MTLRAIWLVLQAEIALCTRTAEVMLAPRLYGLFRRLVTNAADENILSTLGILLQDQIRMISHLSHRCDVQGVGPAELTALATSTRSWRRSWRPPRGVVVLQTPRLSVSGSRRRCGTTK
jgi:hypothetical protein